MLTTPSQQLIIHGPANLQGTDVYVAGSKNAALPIIAGCMLASKPVTLFRIPQLADTSAMLETLCHLGGSISFNEKMGVSITPPDTPNSDIPATLAKKMRTSFLFLGPLLAKCQKATIPLPGGCNIGARPVDIHLAGLKKMGATITLENNVVHAEAKNGLHATHYTLPFPSVTGTENLIMAACLAHGTTTLENAAKDPEVLDLIDFLNSMGAEITTNNTNTIIIKGKKQLTGTTHNIIGDRLEAGTYLIAAAICKSSITVREVNPSHLKIVLEKLEEAGAIITTTKNSITLNMPHQPTAVSIQTEPYPGFPTDLQAQWLSLNAIAIGEATVQEKIYENRMAHARQLCELNANITLDGNIAYSIGKDELKGNDIYASDIRASAGLVLAALAARGQTTIHNIHHLDRGYSFMEENLMNMGVDIKRVHKTKADLCSIKQHINTVIFDWDGTLVNSLPVIMKSHKHVIEKLELPMPDDKEILKLMGYKANIVAEKLFPQLDETLRLQYLQLFVNVYSKRNTSEQILSKKVANALYKLHEQGYRLCVATNKRRAFFQSELSHCGIESIISHTACGDEFPAKPSAQMLIHILNKLEQPAHKCLMVGDHHNDILAAQKISMPIIALTNGSESHKELQSHEPTGILTCVSELVPWLSSTQA